MGKELSISKKDVDKLVGIGFTGHDIGSSNIYPRSVNILQSDKQYDAFIDGDNITKKMYGKLFVRGESNTVSDLVDKIEGVMVKVERGYEIRNEENGIEESGYGFLGATQKEEYESQGLKPINMVKVLIGLENAQTTKEMMEELNKKIEAGETISNNDYPFAVVVVKGSSFGNWFDAERAMQDLANEHFNRPLSQIPVTAFKIAITSKKEEGEGYTYYSMDFDIKPNDIEEALAFTPYLLEAKDQNLFYKVRERVINQEARDAIEFSKAMLADEVSEEDEVDMDDLPF